MAASAQKPVRPAELAQADNRSRGLARARRGLSLLVLLSLRAEHPRLTGGGGVARTGRRRGRSFRGSAHPTGDPRHAQPTAAGQEQAHAFALRSLPSL